MGGTVVVREVRLASAALLAAGAAVRYLPVHDELACPLRTLTGVPCPLCGMTSSVDATVHGRLADALAATPAGAIAVAAAVVVLALRVRRVELPTVVPVMLVLAMWIFQLHRFSIL